MANEEVLGPRKTMFVLVIVVGCFAVLWPRIFAPLLLGGKKGIEPNQYDKDAGCCEVMFESEVAYFKLINEICQSAVGADGKLAPYAAADCRKSVNETCGVDIAAFLKRSENVGKTSKMLLETLKNSNSSCLKENFGVNIFSFSIHNSVNSWTQDLNTLKQERSINRASGQQHPALRERGRAIPANAPTPPSKGPVSLPPHMRVRASPLSVYFDLDIKPPPIPGMRPPLGSPGGPVAAPKSTMGLVLPIYTICIIIFFVYTLSKVLFKRTDGPYEPLEPSPQFRRRVFRDDSRTTPETKLGHKERDTIVSAISGLVAEVRQQMEASYAQNQQRQDAPDNHSRPYTNGNVVTDHPQVRIITSEYREPSRDKLQTIIEPPTPEPIQEPKLYSSELNELSSELKSIIQEPKALIQEAKESSPEPGESSPEPKESSPDVDELLSAPDSRDLSPEPRELSPEPRELGPELKELSPEPKELSPEPREPSPEPKELSPELMELKTELKKTLEQATNKEDIIRRVTEEFLDELKEDEERKEKKQSTPELIADAVKEDSENDNDEENSENDNDDVEIDKSTVKVLGMESTAHMSDGGAFPRTESPVHFSTGPRTPQHMPDDVKSIYLETEIPQQSSVLVADFASGRAFSPPTTKHSSLVVSGKMTLSLIQDPPRDTPERDQDESTIEDFTTASAYTQPVADEIQNDIIEEELSEEEIDEEIEIEEIEEEVTDEEAEDVKQK